MKIKMFKIFDKDKYININEIYICKIKFKQ